MFATRQHFPPIIYTAFAVYVVAFVRDWWTKPSYEIISDELDVIVRETVAQDEDEEVEEELINGAEDGPREELDVEERLVIGERSPQVLKTLLLGTPSPTSLFWTLFTLLVNVGLVLMTTDMVYTAPLLYPANDLSFARVGYVSDKEARILIREPRLAQLPVFVSYRYADPPMTRDPFTGAYPDTAWKSAGDISWLSNDTDYTDTMTLKPLRPDTRYQYSVSTDHTGYFTTAPASGLVSRRNDNRYTFLTSSCIKPRVPYSPFDHALHIPGFKHLSKWIPNLKAHFMLFLGDFIYIDVPQRLGSDASTYRTNYRQIYASPEWPSVSADLPWIHVLDDHEIANDWDGNTTDPYPAAADPWHHYQTSVNPPPTRPGATWFSFTQGPAQFFLMDTRSYRSPEFSATAGDSSKTMLGASQLSDLLTFLRSPPPHGVHWKIVASSIPFTKNWRFGDNDTWAGYAAERQRILEAMWDVGAVGGVGVIVLSGDRHEFAATAFPPPSGGRWPVSATVTEFSCSPLSMFYLPIRTYEQRDEEDVCIK